MLNTMRETVHPSDMTPGSFDEPRLPKDAIRGKPYPTSEGSFVPSPPVQRRPPTSGIGVDVTSFLSVPRSLSSSNRFPTNHVHLSVHFSPPRPTVFSRYGVTQSRRQFVIVSLVPTLVLPILTL